MAIQDAPESSKMHAVPQNIMDVEFKLIGDLTMRQFSYLLFCGVLAYVIYLSVGGIFKWPMVFFLVILGLGLAFVPIQERGLDVWIVNLIRAIYTPTQRVWHKEISVPSALTYENLNVVKQEMITLAPTSSRRKLEEYLEYKLKEEVVDPLDIPEMDYVKKVREAYVGYQPTAPSVGVSVYDDAVPDVMGGPEPVKEEPIEPIELVETKLFPEGGIKPPPDVEEPVIDSPPVVEEKTDEKDKTVVEEKIEKTEPVVEDKKEKPKPPKIDFKQPSQDFIPKPEEDKKAAYAGSSGDVSYEKAKEELEKMKQEKEGVSPEEEKPGGFASKFFKKFGKSGEDEDKKEDQIDSKMTEEPGAEQVSVQEPEIKKVEVEQKEEEPKIEENKSEPKPPPEPEKIDFKKSLEKEVPAPEATVAKIMEDQQSVAKKPFSEEKALDKSEPEPVRTPETEVKEPPAAQVSQSQKPSQQPQAAAQQQSPTPPQQPSSVAQQQLSEPSQQPPVAQKPQVPQQQPVPQQSPVADQQQPAVTGTPGVQHFKAPSYSPPVKGGYYPVHGQQQAEQPQGEQITLSPMTPDMHSGRKFVNLVPSKGELVLPIRGEKVLKTSEEMASEEEHLKDQTAELQTMVDNLKTDRRYKKVLGSTGDQVDLNTAPKTVANTVSLESQLDGQPQPLHTVPDSQTVYTQSTASPISTSQDSGDDNSLGSAPSSPGTPLSAPPPSSAAPSSASPAAPQQVIEELKQEEKKIDLEIEKFKENIENTDLEQKPEKSEESEKSGETQEHAEKKEIPEKIEEKPQQSSDKDALMKQIQNLKEKVIPSDDSEAENTGKKFPVDAAQKLYQKPSIQTPQKEKAGEPKSANFSDMKPLTDRPNIITGIVKSSDGEMLPGVLMVIKNDRQEAVRAIKTNMVGQFELSTPLPNGNYTIEVNDSNIKNLSFDIISMDLKGEILPPVEIIGKSN